MQKCELKRNERSLGLAEILSGCMLASLAITFFSLGVLTPMLRLVRYLKPYSLLILLTIVLLFVQANADLALPDYMSRIVNNGIQQGGVENAVPEAIRQSEMDRLCALHERRTTRRRVLATTPWWTRDSPDYATYVEAVSASWPRSRSMCSKDVDQAEIDQLNPVMGKALLVGLGHRAGAGRPVQGGGHGDKAGLRPVQAPAGHGSLCRCWANCPPRSWHR